MTTITSTEAGATGRYINLGSPASQDDIGAQTIIAYCKPTGAGGGGSAYLFGKTPTASPNGLRFFIADNTGSPSLGFGQNSSDATLPSALTAAGTITYGGWQHLAFTWDGTVNTSGILFYINNTLTAKASESFGTAPITADAANDLFLMNRGNSGALGREFVGDVGYIARWNRVLNSTERASVSADGPLTVPSGLILCWANDQDYSTNAITATARSTRVTGSTPMNTALGGSAATATTLSGPSSGTTGVASTNFTVGANGTITGTVVVTPGDASNGGTFTPTTVSISSGTPTGTFTYTPASTGAKTISISDNGGLTDATPLSYTSNAAVTKGATLTLYNGATLQASLTGIRALWWDATDPTGAPAFATATASTDASGIMTLNLDSTTSLAIGASGFLLLYKLDGSDHRDSLEFAGRVVVSSI